MTLSLLLNVTCAISTQYNLLDPLNHLHWSLSSNHLEFSGRKERRRTIAVKLKSADKYVRRPNKTDTLNVMKL